MFLELRTKQSIKKYDSKKTSVTVRQLDTLLDSHRIRKSHLNKEQKIKKLRQTIKKKKRKKKKTRVIHNTRIENNFDPNDLITVNYQIEYNDTSKRGAQRHRKTERFVIVPRNTPENEIKKTMYSNAVEYFNEFNLGEFEDLDELEAEIHYISGVILKSSGFIASSISKPPDGNIGNMFINKNTFNKIPYNIDANNDEFDGNCFSRAVTEFYGTYPGNKKFCKLITDKTKKGEQWTVDSVCEILTDNKKSFICLNFYGKTYKKYTDKKSKRRIFRFFGTNEHIYPINKKEYNAIFEVKKDKLKIHDIQYIRKDKINDFVAKKMTESAPLKLKYDEYENRFDRIVFDETLYITDKNIFNNYKLIKTVCGDYPIPFIYKGYEPFLHLAYTKKLFSTFDEHLDSPFGVYFNDPDVHFDNPFGMTCIDKNKSFSHALSSLEYLPVFDVTTQQLPFNEEVLKNKFKGEIDPYCFYHIKHIIKNNYNLLSVGWHSGFELLCVPDFNKCVEVDKYIIPILKKNPYTELITNILKENPTVGKEIINPFVGIMNRKGWTQSMCYNGLTNSREEAEGIFKNPIELYNGLYTDKIYIENKNKFTENLKPIAIMVSDRARYAVSQKLRDLKKLDKNIEIRTLKTDSILFYSNKKLTPEQLDIHPSLTGWHFEEITANKISTVDKTTISSRAKQEEPMDAINYNDIKTEDWPELLEHSLLFDCYAGSGKSTLDISTIIPHLIENNKSYIVVGTKHTTLTAYYYKKFNSKVIQYFEFNRHLQDILTAYDYIIVDEAGLLDHSHYELFYKRLGTDAKLICLGDADQLLPFDTPREQKDSLMKYSTVCGLFDKRILMTDNWRNKYTKDDYDKMKNLTYDIGPYEKECINVIGKLNVAVTNKTRNRINNIVVNHKGWTDTFAHLKVAKGGTLVSTFSNDRRNARTEFNKMEIYNSSFFTIMNYTQDVIELKDEINVIHSLRKDLFTDNFDYGYCITTYKSQGDSIPYKKYGIFDWDIIKKDGRQLYTVLSRILDPWPVDKNGKQIKPLDSINPVEPLDIKANQSKSIEDIPAIEDIQDIKNMTISFDDF